MYDAMIVAQLDRVQVEQRLEFAALPSGWAAVALVAAAMALCWQIVRLYRREARAGASQRVRLIMAGLRCLVVLGLLAIWLQPVVATYLHRWIDSYTLVLVDTSSSMDLQDRYRTAEAIDRVQPVVPEAGQEPVRRTAVVERVIGDDSNRFLRELTENNRVKLYTFAESAKSAYTLQAQREARFTSLESTDKPADDTQPKKASDLQAADTRFNATGAVTDLGRALRQSVESLGRSPLAGVVVLTDGGLNTGDSAETIARYARDRGVPLHVIGVGDASPPRNVRVAEVIAPDSVFAADPFAVVAQIIGQGMAGETVTAELVERRAGDAEGRIVASKSVTIDRDNAVEPITFDHEQKGVGRYIYRVQIPVGETESVADDNTRQTVVNIIENRLRVLLVAGTASWDYRYVSRLLQRDDTFEVSCWLQSADIDAVRDGNIVIDHLPATAEELFAYDAVILLDPDPLEITGEWSDLLAELVAEHGGGVLYGAARMNTPAFMNDAACTPIVRILPVTIDQDAELVLNEIGHFQRQDYGVVIPPTAAGHPVLQREGGESSPIGWEQMGGVYWHYPVLREKPVATVLMRHGNPRMQNAYGRHVLLATQYVGSGRTAFLGFDGTWRWRAFGEEVFNRFWVQLIRHLVEGKLTGGNRRGMVLTESDSYQLGESIRVTARLFNQSFEPLQTDAVQAQYRLEDETGQFQLRRVDERPGWYEGRFVPPRTGSCEITLAIPGGELSDDVARREIQIVRPNLEIVQPQLDRELLVGLAEQSAGGSYYDVNEAMRVPEAIPDRHESTTIRSRPAPLWDDTWVLILLVGLLSLEWTMRKVFKLL